MGKFYFDAELSKLSSRGCADIFRSCVTRGLMILAGSVLLPVCAQGAYTVGEDGKTSQISSLEDLQAALRDERVATVVLAPPSSSSPGYEKDPKAAFVLPDGFELKSEGMRKVVQVVDPFLPEDGRVRIGGSGDGTYIESPVQGEYSEYCLFHIEKGSKVTIENLTLMGGFTGSRTVADKPSVGGIDNYGYLEMHDVDVLRTGTALLNRPGARAALVHCNIVRNANWYGGGILNFAQRVGTSDEYTNGGTLVMDCCSLTENESLGPSHGGGAAENQGLMCLNNCVVANNASTEIGGASTTARAASFS